MSVPSPASVASPDAAPPPWLVADIGGTNARFGWIDEAGGRIVHSQSLPVAAYEGPLAAAQAYLAQVRQVLGSGYRPPAAGAWAVATAIVGDEVELTNAGWRFSRQRLWHELGLHTFLLLNDFEALALSLPRLAPGQLRRIDGAAPGTVQESAKETAQETAHEALPRHAVRAVIGPGTGLGVAGLAPCPARSGDGPGAGPHWLAIPGEGGHATLAPHDDLESSLLAAVRRHHAHVSAERLLSGVGLPVLHQAVAHIHGAAAPELRTEAIVAAGTAAPGEAAADPLCRETLEHFCALLGGFAGNVALTLGARGGVYIGGGIVPRLGDLFMGSRFRARFEAKGRFETYLRAIPTWLIVDTHVALSGASMALQQLRAR
jgi:glucokinase